MPFRSGFLTPLFVLVLACGAGEAGAEGDTQFVDTSTVKPSDSAAVLLNQVDRLEKAEREAFRAFQRLSCIECDAEIGLLPDFTASSAAMLREIAAKFPSDPRVLFRWSAVLVSQADMGYGDVDTAKLRQAGATLRRALTLSPREPLRKDIEHLLELVETPAR